MQVWEEFLASKEKELGKTTTDKWLRSLNIIKFDAINLYLEAKDSFQIIWFNEHIRPKLHKELLDQNQRPIKVHLQLKKTQADSSPKKDTHNNEAASQEFELIYDELLLLHTFNHYLPTDKNFLAFKFLSQIGGYDIDSQSNSKPEIPLAKFNPIYLYGPSGSGKTHLLMSLARTLTSQGHKVIYSKGSSFIENTIKAIRKGQMSIFRKYYRNTDILIIDDVHLFSNKTATQEELFHTFNTLHVEGHQIILSSNVPPYELTGIEPRLVSRFEWGISLPIGLPKKTEMNRILDDKLNHYQFPLKSSVKDFLLASFSDNPKELDKAINAFMLRIHLHKPSLEKHPSKHLSVDEVEEILHDLIETKRKQSLTPEKIIESTANYYGIRIQDILGKSRSRDCTLPRQISMYLCRSKLSLPFMKIGQIFFRDHSTVMTSVKYIENFLEENNPDILQATKFIINNIS